MSLFEKDPESLMAPFEPRLNWERREFHAHAVRNGGCGWASRLISAILGDLGLEVREREEGLSGIAEGIRGPKLWLCTCTDGERSAETAMLLGAARALFAEYPQAPAGFLFSSGSGALPRPCVLLETSAELPAGRIRCENAPERLKQALSACPAEMLFGGEPGPEIRITVGKGGVSRFEKDLTLLPAGAIAVLIPALLIAENRG